MVFFKKRLNFFHLNLIYRQAFVRPGAEGGSLFYQALKSRNNHFAKSMVNVILGMVVVI